MSSRSQKKLVVDLRCGIHRDSAGDKLFLELRRKPLEEWSTADALSYARSLVCTRDEAFEFVVPLLLRVNSNDADSAILRFAPRASWFRHDIEFELERRWKDALTSENAAKVLRVLELAKVLTRTEEALLTEWIRFGRSFKSYVVERFGSYALELEQTLVAGWILKGLPEAW